MSTKFLIYKNCYYKLLQMSDKQTEPVNSLMKESCFSHSEIIFNSFLLLILSVCNCGHIPFFLEWCNKPKLASVEQHKAITAGKFGMSCPLSKILQRFGVHKFSCNNYVSFYIGQMGQSFHTRDNVHIKDKKYTY